MSPELSMRASDRDRERVVWLLREQTALGRLTLGEFEDRMAAALVARTWADLREVTADLPVSLPVPGTPRAAAPAPRRGLDWSDLGYWALFSLPLLVAVLAWILNAPVTLLLVVTVVGMMAVATCAG